MSAKVKKGEVFSLGELYSGPGGMARGILDAKSDDGRFSVKHEWASDIDPDSCATYIDNICRDNPKSVYNCDVRNLPINELTNITAFAYGFPCNSFSNVGKHEGFNNKKYGQLYWFGVKILRKFQPKWFIAENVSGILSTKTNDFTQICKDLKDSNYKLYIHHYKAELYGIPQIRHRVIIVGIRKDLDIDFKIPSPEPYANKDIRVKTAISNIPDDAENNELIKLSNKVTKRLSYIHKGQNVWQAMENGQIPDELKIKATVPISSIYRKLDPERPSYTITANGGGGTHGYHWDNRALTNRERARIQTFRDDYVFKGSVMSVRKQIGMAVPPDLANIIAKAILNSFAGIDYPSVNPNIGTYE